MTSQTFTVIAGDLIGSRKHPGREEAARRIRSAIAAVMNEYREEFYAPLVLTRGMDELSGVLRRPDKSYRICRSLNEKLFPLRFRFAIVRGGADVAVKSRDAARMDGPAFHTASDLIKLAKKEDRCYYFSLGAGNDPCLNEMASLIEVVRGGASRRRRHMMELYARYNDQMAVAKRLGISQQAVSDALRQANYRELRRAENLLEKELSKS
jgi:hypothetical protein